MNGILLNAAEFITKKVGDEIVSEQLTTTMEMSDRIGYAIQRSIIGMIIVFGVLAIIWLVLSLFKVVFYKDPNKKNKKEEKEVSETVQNVPTAPAAAPIIDNGATIAAIIAAISALRNEEGVTGGFRVVSFKRGTSKPWNKK